MGNRELAWIIKGHEYVFSVYAAKNCNTNSKSNNLLFRQIVTADGNTFDLTDAQKKAKAEGKFVAPVAGAGAVVAIIAGVLGFLAAIVYVGYRRGWVNRILKKQ